MNSDVQKSLISAIEITVDEQIKNIEYTSSHIGLVKEVKGFTCIVELYGSLTECKLTEHLHTTIKIGDIVLIQDLYNNNVSKYIISKIGESN